MDSTCFHINYEFLLKRFNFRRLVFISGVNRTLARLSLSFYLISCLSWLKSEHHFVMKFYFRIFHCWCNRIDCNLKLYLSGEWHSFAYKMELKWLFRVFVCFFRSANIVISLQLDTFHKFHDSSLYLFFPVSTHSGALMLVKATVHHLFHMDFNFLITIKHFQLFPKSD